jgi:hypothetical protein
MRCHSSKVILTLVVMAVLGLSGPVVAGNLVPFQGRLEGTYTRTTVFPFAHIELSGRGQATQLGQFAFYMPHDVDLSAIPPGGTGRFQFTAANGDTVYGTFVTHATPTPTPGVIYGVEQMTILGGTGRFANATGGFICERLIDTVNFRTIGSFDGQISSPGAGNP